MADGREATLKSQAIDASLSHMELKTAPNEWQLKQIVAFECQVFVAQSFDRQNWVITQKNAPPGLGPQSLALAVKISAYLKSAPDGAVFQSFDNWKNGPDPGSVAEQNFRRSVARGAEIFNHRPLEITGAVGVNTSSAPLSGSCASCHDISDERHGLGALGRYRSSDQPALGDPGARSAAGFKITCNPDAPAHPFLGREIITQDPGRAMTTGKCADVGAIAVQQLRGLSARAPYFSNGSAQTLEEVVDFYDRRFEAGFSAQEKQDLVNFAQGALTPAKRSASKPQNPI